jgi:hypothetical protein
MLHCRHGRQHRDAMRALPAKNPCCALPHARVSVFLCDAGTFSTAAATKPFALVEKPYRRDVLAVSLRATVERVSRVGA